MWDACPEADPERIDLEDLGGFDNENAKTAFNQITNGYKQLLEAMAKSGCRKQNRYRNMVSWGLRFENFRNLSWGVFKWCFRPEDLTILPICWKNITAAK